MHADNVPTGLLSLCLAKEAPHCGLEVVSHKAVNHRVQAAVEAAEGDGDVVRHNMVRQLRVEVDQHLPHMEGREADGEDD